jgi:hypothetical protein
MTVDMEDRRRAALDLLEQTRLATRALFSGIDPERVIHTDERAWRVRDVLGHLAAWNAEAARSLEAYADGGEYIVVGGRGKYYDYNGVAAAARSAWPVEQVWAEYESSHDQLRQIVAHMPASKWDGGVIYPWNEHGTVEGLIRIMMKHETTDHCELIEKAMLT